MKRSNCGKKGYFAYDYSEPKKVETLNINENATYMSSSVFLVESNLLWTVDSGATDHVAKDREVFVEFRRVP